MYLPVQLITTASFGTGVLVPAETILPSRITKVALLIVVCPSFTMVALVKA